MPHIPRTSAGRPGNAPVRIDVLGRFSVEVNGEPLRFAGRAPHRPLELLKALVALGGHSVAGETLADALWPEAEGDQANHALHTTVGRLRQLIGAEAVTVQDGRLTLEPARCWVDAFACAHHLAQAERLLGEARPEPAAAELQAALELYHGPLLDGEFAPAPVLPARERLHGQLLRVVEAAGVALHHEQRHDKAIALYRRALERDDQAEALYQGLMSCCLAAGRTAEGLAAYQRCRDVLQHALSTSPSARTEQLRGELTARAGDAGHAAGAAAPSPPASPEPAAAAGAAEHRPLRRRHVWVVAAVAVVLATATAGAGLVGSVWLRGRPPAPDNGTALLSALPQRDRPSIAVLPFANLSSEPDGELLADGITENLTTALARLRQLLVIARTSTMRYKSAPKDVREIGRELGVRYVLEGSVQRTDDRLRVTAQLIDTATSGHLWAEQYDRPMGQFFEVQDEILRHIVVALDVTLLEGDQSRMRSSTTTSLDAWLLYRQGLPDFRQMRKPRNLQARRAFRQALARDPDFTSARVGLAWTYAMEGRFGWSDDPGAALEEAERLARQVLARNDSSGAAHMVLGSVFNSRRDFERTLLHYRRAAALSPNGASIAGGLAKGLMVDGQLQAALAQFRHATQLAPHPPPWLIVQHALTLYLLERPDAAVRMLQPLKDKSGTHLLIVASLVAADRLEEAREAAAHAERRFGPGPWVAGNNLWRIPFRQPRYLQRIRGHLARAGIEVPPSAIRTPPGPEGSPRE